MSSGQALLCRRMGKNRVIAETGAGQHGVATATAAALLGLDCTIYMGRVDTERQALNVARMKLLGAEVIPVDTGSATLKDAINEAFRDWVTNVGHTYYVFGTAAGPYPFPLLVRDFQRIIGLEARQQVLDLTGRLPDAIAACVGGGSNAIGIFHAFLDDADVRLVGLEAGGDGIETGRHASTICGGTVGVLHGARSYLLQDDEGQIIESHSISAGLDYPGSAPSTPIWPRSAGRSSGRSPTPRRWTPSPCCPGPRASSRRSSPRMRWPARWSWPGRSGPTGIVLINVSGRGDKDMETAMRWFGLRRATGRGPASPARRTDRPRAAPRSADVTVAVLERTLRDRQGRGPGGPDRLPAGRIPRRGRIGRNPHRDDRAPAATWSRSGCRSPIRCWTAR